MKTNNWYMISLMVCGILALSYSVINLGTNQLNIFFIMIGMIIILELLPIQLPSGDQFEAGSIGFLFVLLHLGFGHAVLAASVGLFAYLAKTFKTINISFFRIMVNVGMYSFSMLAAYFVWHLTKGLPMILSVLFLSFVYEFVNLLILEGIQKMVRNREMFTHFKQQLTELIVPVIVYAFVLSGLLILKTDNELILSVLYLLFFLLILNFFSRQYINQLFLRQSTTRAFIQVLEQRITSSLAGHGNRVGMIIDILFEDLGYPKRKRHDLVQVAIIHDIGKALLPSYIFRKRGKLTLSEEQEYKTHPEKAVEIVKTMFPKETFSCWILHHHERWDGKGFPSRLKGDNIPLESRMIALANELDHLFSRHDDIETIMKLLKEKSGTILDPNLVKKVEPNHIEIIQNSINTQSPQTKKQEKEEIVEYQYAREDSYSNIGESFFLETKNGKVTMSESVLPTDFVQTIADIASERQKPVHETYINNHLTFEVHAQSLQNGEISIFVQDLTPYLEYRKVMERKILESYGEVINILTEGKIKLYLSKAKLKEQLGEWIDGMPINSNSDIPKSRELTKMVLKKYPAQYSSLKVQLSVTEAATNILKHATAGRLSIYRQDDFLQFLVEDKGSGIPLHEIPKTILVSGYSSKRSLGKGFKMIAAYSDGVQIYTSSEGTYLLLEYELNEKQMSNDAS